MNPPTDKALDLQQERRAEWLRANKIIVQQCEGGRTWVASVEGKTSFAVSLTEFGAIARLCQKHGIEPFQP